MSGKGHRRRPTDEAAFAEGFDRIFGKKLLGSSSTVEQATLTGPVEGSNPPSPAISSLEVLPTVHYQMDADGGLVYVDDATGKMVDEDYWPNG